MPTAASSKKETWTIESLKEYFEMRFDNLESALDARFIAQEKALEIATDAATKRLDARFVAQEKAITVATESSDKRLESMNEFRNSLKDQAGTFITKTDQEGLISVINEKFDRINESIKSIQISDAVLAGKATQGQMIIAYIISIIGILFGIVNIITK
jgi:hypothetical protein